VPVVRPKIALTAGDPAGIGPEIVAKAASDPRVLEVCEPIVYEPPRSTRFEAGVLSGAAGRAAYDVLLRAVKDAQSGAVDAIATAPVNKEAF
jgi:4-hydroxy-L-threonine phosphate dehydrogenase PdxA